MAVIMTTVVRARIMSALFLLLLLLLSSLTLSALAQTACNTALSPFVLPNVNTTQKLAIVSPPEGAEVFDTTQNALSVYNGTVWQMLNPSFPDGLTISSTTAALVPPAMTTTQKTAITSPSQGAVVFDSTQGALNVFNGNAWKQMATVFAGSQSFANPGYYTFTGGLIVQWQTLILSPPPGEGGTFSFPIAFPNDCMIVLTSWADNEAASSGGVNIYVANWNASSFNANFWGPLNGAAFSWFAIGY